MLESRFLWQVWGVLGLTLVISTFVFGFFVVDEVERDAFDRIENSLHEQALALSPLMTHLLEENRLLTPEEINRLAPGVIARITLADSDGRVMIDNQRDPSGMDNHRYRPEIVGSQGAVLNFFWRALRVIKSYRSKSMEFIRKSMVLHDPRLRNH